MTPVREYSSWLLWSAFPPHSNQRHFRLVQSEVLPATASYQFQATVANNLNQTPFDVPSILADHDRRYAGPVYAHLPAPGVQ